MATEGGKWATMWVMMGMGHGPSAVWVMRGMGHQPCGLSTAWAIVEERPFRAA